jgi:hypothetical protein
MTGPDLASFREQSIIQGWGIQAFVLELKMFSPDEQNKATVVSGGFEL